MLRTRRAILRGHAWRLSAALLILGASVQLSSAAVAASPVASITLDRSTGLLRGQQVSITGSGFAPFAPVTIIECNNTPGQPTIYTAGLEEPVGCTDPFGATQPVPNFGPGFTDGAGAVTATIVVQTGIIGPPSLGIDSAGNNAAADTANYPCPPTAVQQAAGASCMISVAGYDGKKASANISFGTPISTNPSASVSPSSGLINQQTAKITGSGFTPHSPGFVLECNFTPGEPGGGFPDPELPIGCTNLFRFNGPISGPVPGPGRVLAPPTLNGAFLTAADGTLDTTFTIQTGNIGGTIQSVAYPCPPTAANVAAGGSCALRLQDGALERVQAPIAITGPPAVASATMFPTAGLTAGRRVDVAGTGFVPGSPGGVLECNEAPGQPTVLIVNVAAPVGCSNPYTKGSLFSPSTTGTVSASIVVSTGVVGPPQPGPDSSGKDAAVDAAKYPCPPTQAQQAAGISCDITIGDLSGDVVRQLISFTTSPPSALGQPAVGMAVTPHGSGHWLVSADGGVFGFGNAAFHGSLPAMGIHPATPIVSMAATADGGGYWLASADGGVFGFGDAAYHGSLPALHLHPLFPIAAIAATPDGHGYWLADVPGNVFNFGSATFDFGLPLP